MQFLACILKAVIPRALYHGLTLNANGIGYNTFGFGALVIFPFLPVAQLFSCAACGLALLAQGCMSGNSTRKASSLKSTKNVQSSAPELSSRNQSMLALYSAEIEAAADRIISESASVATQRQALVWKAEAIPVMQTSLLNTDPVAGKEPPRASRSVPPDQSEITSHAH